ncbi:MAG: type 4a pilus biogenesis protein PilO [Planctomycetota bacterium]
MGRFTEKQLTIMTIVVAVVIAGLFAYLIYEDLRKIEEEKANIETLTDQIRVADAEIAKKKARETDVIVYREVVERDSKILPDQSEINDFINVIGDFEKYSGVVVTQVQGLKERATARRGAKEKKSAEAILKIPLKLKLRGTMDQYLKFINLFENHERFVRISGFQISASRLGSGNGSPQHDIGLELETYQYDPKGGEVKRVAIPNYERRKQEIAIQKRIRAEKPAHIEKYQMKPRISRRDPFVDPREAESDPDDVNGEPENDAAAQRAILDELILEIGMLADDVRMEKKLKEAHDYMRLAAVARAIDQRMSMLDFRVAEVIANREITIPELKEEFNEKVVSRYEAIKEERKASAEREEVLVERKQVWETLQKMKTRFGKGQYQEALQIYQGFDRLTQGRHFSPDAEPLKEQMDTLAQQAQVIVKFESEPMKIGGVIIDPKRASFAIINDQVLSEGDFVDEEGRIKIVSIKQDEIVFEYQGVTIPKRLNRGK